MYNTQIGASIKEIIPKYLLLFYYLEPNADTISGSTFSGLVVGA